MLHEFMGQCHEAKVLLLLWSSDISPRFHVVDLFSGVGQIAKRYRRAGLAAVEYDFIVSPAMNFLSASGFALLGVPIIVKGYAGVQETFVEEPGV